MSEEIIESYIDRGKFKSDTDFVVSEIERAKTAYESLSKSKINIQSSKPLTDVSAGIKEAEKATQALLKTQLQLIAAKKAQIQLENELLKQSALSAKEKSAQQANELAELKKQNIQITIAAKEKLAADREALKAAKEKSAAEKQAAAEAVEAGRERIAQLREEQNQIRKIEEAERARAQAEQQALSGNYNPGGGKGNAPINTPVKLTIDEGNIILMKSYESEISKLTIEQKNAKIAVDAGTISQNQYKKIIAESTLSINGYKKNIADLNTQLKLSAAVNDSERNSLSRAQALIAQYTFEKKKLNLATEEGRRLNDNYNKAIAASNAFIIKNADSETVRTKSVGNYFDAVKKGAGTAFSALRTLANIIPGLGISGLLLVIVEPLAQLFSGLFTNANKAIERFKEFSDTIKQAGSSSKNAAAEVFELKTNVDLAKEGFISKDQVVKQYNETMGKTVGVATSLNDVERALANSAEAYIKFTFLKAVATASFAKAADQAVLAQEILFEKQFKKKENKGKTLLGLDMETTIEDLGNKAINKTGEKGVEFFKMGEDFEKKAAELFKKAGFTNFFGNDKVDKGKKDKSLQALKELLNTEFEQYKINQKRIIQSYEDRANGEKEAGRLTELTYSERIDALNKYSTAVLELNKKQEQEDIANKEREAKREIDRLNEEKKGKDPTQIARINENIKIVESNLQQSLALIRTDAFDKRIDIYKNNEKKFDDITKQFNDKRIDEIKKQNEAEAQKIEDGINTRKAILNDEYSDDIQSLSQRFADGKVSQKQYNKERKKLDDEYRLASLEAEIKYTKEVLNLMQARGIDVKKELAVLANLEIQYSDTKKKLRDDDAKETLEMLNEIQSYYTQISGVISSALNAAATTRKNEIQEEIDLIDKRKEADLAANDARVQSDQDRAANTIVINARAQAEREKLERRQKEIDRQKAQAEKALSIFSITLSTAKNVADAKTPFGKILAAISGAAQLAIAIATPIPKFKHGKRAGNNYEGPGIVNDGPKMEAIERADGSIEFPQGRDVLTYVGKNDIIHPDKDVWLNAILNAAHRDANASMRFIPESKKDNSLSIAMKKQTQLLQQIANKKELNLSAKQGGMEALWKWGSNQTKYVNENTNWQ